MKIAIMGSGFSGIMTFYYLVKLLVKSEDKTNESLEITFISKEKSKGGIAYAKAAGPCNFLMNIPIDQMSALEHEPNDLLEWLNQSSTINKNFYTEGKRSKILPHQYCRREDYGKYLQAKYEEAKKDIEINGKPFTLQEFFGYEAIDISENTEGISLTFKNMDDGNFKQVNFHRVIVASGNDLPFKQPKIITENIAHSSSYIGSIWEKEAISTIQTIALEENKKVLVLGTALSSMDLVIAWYEAIKKDNDGDKQYTSQLILSSRHGLLHEPYPKNSSMTSVENKRKSKGIQQDQSKEFLEENIKKLVEDSENHTHHFREEKYNDLRELINLAYPNLTEEEKIKILPWITRSHLETMATGMPYPTAKKIAELAVENLLDVYAGEITTIDLIKDKNETQFNVSYKNGKKIVVDYIVNAIGVEHDYTQLKHPFYTSLMKIAASHVSGFDLKTSDEGRLVKQDNTVSAQIYCVGSMCSASQAMRDKPILSLLRSIVKLRKQTIATATGLLSSLNYTVVSNKLSQTTDVKKKASSETDSINYLPLDPEKLISESFIKMTNSEQSYLSTVTSDVLTGNGNKAFFVNPLFIDSKMIMLQNCKIVGESTLKIKAEKAIFENCEIDLNSLESNSNRNFKVENCTLDFTKNTNNILWAHTGNGTVKLSNVTFIVNSSEGKKQINLKDLGIENKKKLHGFMFTVDKKKNGQNFIARWIDPVTKKEQNGQHTFFSNKKRPVNLFIDTQKKALEKESYRFDTSPTTPT